MSALDVGARGLASVQRRRLSQTQGRLDWWSRSHRRSGDPYPVMATPPAITLSPRTSTLIASNDWSNISVSAEDARLSYAGAGRALVGGNQAKGIGGTLIDGSTVGPLRVRFLTDAPAFEFTYASINGPGGVGPNVIVDGQYATRGTGGVPQNINSGQTMYEKVDFGAASDPVNLYYSQVSIGAGGTGYAMGDVVTVDGGTFTRPARLRVIQLAGSAAFVFAVEDGGAYSVLPTTFTTTALTGAGTAATFATPVVSRGFVGRRLRRIELMMQGLSLRGIIVKPQDTLLSWPVSPRAPRVMVVGDSQNAGTYLAYAGGNMAYSWAQRLGLHDALILSAMGGTGWVTANGNSPAWSHANRVADVIAAAPDLLVYDGSQNDGSSSAVQAAVTATLNAVLGALPNLRVIVAGPVVNGTAAYMAGLVAGVAACVDPSRVRVIDPVAEGWITGASTASVVAPTGTGNRDWYAASDTAHLSQAGADYRAAIMAERVAWAVQDMVG